MHSLIKIFGGQHYHSKWIVSLFPKDYEDMFYWEMFAGGASILLRKNKSEAEHLNEINLGIHSLWQEVIYGPTPLINALSSLKYEEETFNTKSDNTAVGTFVKYRMSRGGMGKTFAWSDRLRGGKPGDVNAWENSIKNIPIIHQRVKDVSITHYNAIKLLKLLNQMCDREGIITANDLYYLDPPFLPETRKSKNVYENEMTAEQHEELLAHCLESRAKIAISAYESPMYNSLLGEWNTHKKEVSNSSGQTKKKSKRTNVLYCNY